MKILLIMPGRSTQIITPLPNRTAKKAVLLFLIIKEKSGRGFVSLPDVRCCFFCGEVVMSVEETSVLGDPKCFPGPAERRPRR